MTVSEDLGTIRINEEVVARHASMALAEVDGIVTLTGRRSYSDFVGLKGGVEKGVSVSMDDATASCTVHIEVNIVYGVNVYDTARKLQNTVKHHIEQLVGLNVERVNVTIKNVEVLEDARPLAPAAEY